MTAPRIIRWTLGGLGLAAAGYAVTVGAAWYRYGRPAPPKNEELDPLLDRFMPTYEVAERHHVRVMAPADVTLKAAMEANLQQSAVVRAIFRTRELVLGAKPDSATHRKGLFAEMTSLGWRVLAETPGREVVAGAVTQPWLTDVVFRGLPREEFRDFREPGFVKIVWTLRADPVGPGESIFRTETRVATTDATARARFRWYWARFSPGIILIRRMLIGQLKAEAERRAAGATAIRPEPAGDAALP